MVITTSQRKKQREWTYDQLLAELPESNQPTELWDGELIMAPSPTPIHQEIVLRLSKALYDFIFQNQSGVVYLSPLDVILTQRRVVQPDILYISNERRSIIQDRVRGAPDLIIEVVSPGSWRQDHVDKRALYEQFGVKEYWIVDPEAQMIEIFDLVEGSYNLYGRFGSNEYAKSKLLPGFEIPVKDIIS